MRTIATVLVLAVGSCGNASEEEFLLWSEVRIVAAETKQTGTVVFSAKIAEKNFQEIHLEAFGKKFTVAKDDLRKLSRFPLSSLVTTHEAGYERLGGHTVHFKFKREYYDMPGEKSAKLIEEKMTVSVSRGKGLRISEPQWRVLNAELK